MTIKIRKDPTRRLGGWALISFEGVADEVSVVIERDEGTLCLGPHGWQGAPHTFDPYPVERGASGPFIRVGPEIVNRLEPYLMVTVRLPEVEAVETLSWPDEVIPSPDAFEGGGVQGDDSLIVRGPPKRRPPPPPPPPGGSGDETPPPPPPGGDETKTPPPPPPPPQTVTPRTQTPPPPPGPGPDKPRRPVLWPVFLLLGVLMLAGAGAGYWYWADIKAIIDDMGAQELVDGEPQPDQPPVTPAETETETPAESETETATDTPSETPGEAPPDAQVTQGPPTCSLDDARGAGDPARFREIMRLCREAGQVEIEIEAMARLPREAEIALRWAQLYDPRRTETDVPIRPDPAAAARLYKDAAEDGVAEAAEALAGLCEWLGAQTDLRYRTMFTQHCE